MDWNDQVVGNNQMIDVESKNDRSDLSRSTDIGVKGLERIS